MAAVTTEKEAATKDLQRIPGVGPSISQDLWLLGYRSVDQLKGEKPEAMYERLCAIQGTHVDRCVLYVFRCAVYFATEQKHDPQKLQWWNWKD